jgi:phenylacetic acid degradation operon negative regulatory protein
VTLTAAPALTTRSVVLSLLLGAHPGRLPARDLVAMGEEFGVAPATMRVTLSRLVAAGDLVNDGSVYALSERHLRRQAEQDEALAPHVGPYDGSWTVLVVTATGRDAASRAGLRSELRRRRLAELREGVWMRPANVSAPVEDDGLVSLRSYPEDDRALAARLWDLDDWVATADELLEAADPTGSLRDRFVANAAIVRHQRADPLLPPELRPARWPADDLRSVYDDFRTELTALRTEEMP